MVFIQWWRDWTKQSFLIITLDCDVMTLQDQASRKLTPLLQVQCRWLAALGFVHQPGVWASIWRQKTCFWQGHLLANLQWETANSHGGWGLIYSSSVSKGHRSTGKNLWFKNQYFTIFWQCRRKYSWTHLTAHFFSRFSICYSHPYMKWRVIFYPYKVYNRIFVC